ncbi:MULTISPECIES: hypothetical protein [unclassified Streptomyces]|uniref:hypothetical protein n=1 Tax=unclassified Streptomyces TaxID=2593676 RepID=UPI000FD97833|nr:MULTISPECIES: hypothetical protein [unclassified Streptomyces]UQA37100.1 hypothetical protein KRR37_27740 [Streptomyces sp. HNA39]
MKVADGASNVLAQAQAAEEAGATALLVHRPSAGDWQPGIGYGAAPLPVLALRADEAAVLTGALGKGKAEVSWRATAVSPYVYNLSFPETRPVTSDRTCKVRDRTLGSVVSTHESMGVAADFVDTLLVSRPHGGTFGASNLDVVAAPGKRTEYYTAGDTVWQKIALLQLPLGRADGRQRPYVPGPVGPPPRRGTGGSSAIWKFRSERKPEVPSQPLPLLFPRYDVPADGMKTVLAKEGLRIGLTATGHAGRTPGRITAATVSFSYDGGETWHAAATGQQGGTWTATVDHADAAGRTVTLRTELTDADGNSVVQTVNDAYAVR